MRRRGVLGRVDGVRIEGPETGQHPVEPIDRRAERVRQVGIDVALGLGVAIGWWAAFQLGTSRGWRPVEPDAWRLVGPCLGLAVAVRRTAGPWTIAMLALAYPLAYFRPLASYFHLMPLLVLGFAGAQRIPRRLWVVVGATAAAVAVLFSPVVVASSRAPGDVVDALWPERVGQSSVPATPAPGSGPRPYLEPYQTNWSGLALAEFATLSVVLLGAAMASQRQVATDLAQRNAELERLRRVDAERAVADERLRISRDLHDVVAHHLTAILMRSQAADRVRTSRPEEAHAAVAWIAEESRDALRATRATISALRDGPSDAARADGELVDDLGQIVDRVGQVGLDARLAVRWAGVPALAPSVGVAVRRVVQEALTNVLKHARASEALVTLRDVEGGLGIDVVDNGVGRPGPAAADEPGGAGLLGMEERLAACGGRLRYGPTDTGGWRVRLWVPIQGGGER